eukprot:c26353_g1_i1.p2 GENE.c26353_g1_i1~~c26353_g1_i1.p2  ORF type:complete len:175 (-),score=37.81 c26353_g1_i1:64-588(-)
MSNDFDIPAQPQGSSFLQLAAGLLASVGVVAVPIFLFSQILSLSLAANVLLYGVGTVGGTIIVFQSYITAANATRIALIARRSRELEAPKIRMEEKTKWSTIKPDLEAEIEAVSALEALTGAVLRTNAIYLASVAVFALVLFKNVAVPTNYALTTACSSAVVFFIASASAKPKN